MRTRLLNKSLWLAKMSLNNIVGILCVLSMSGSVAQAVNLQDTGDVPTLTPSVIKHFSAQVQASPYNARLSQNEPTDTENDPLKSKPREPVEPVKPLPPPPPPEDEPLTSSSGTCSVGVLANVVLKCPRTHDNRSVNTRVETHNLAAGFDEIVIPNYCAAKVTLLPAPNVNTKLPGTLTAGWSYTYKRGRTSRTEKLFTGSGHYKSNDALKKGWKKKNGKSLKARTKKTAYTDIHTVNATFKPDGGEPCNLKKSFPVTFTPKNFKKTPPTQKLEPFVRRHEGQIKEATRQGKKPKTGARIGTKIFDSKRNAVTVPVGVFWNLDNGCCKIRGATPRIIQFARAGISGPNGNQGKPWTLDITTGQIKKAMKDRKRNPAKGLMFDPTYTNAPGKDALVEKANASGSKRIPGGIDVLQWDSPGMPQSLYDRLRAANSGQSIYRQQFLTLLVCRKNKGKKPYTTAAHYLDNALVSQIVVTTVTWTFPGKGKEEKISYTTDTKACDANNCPSLRDFLKANGLLERFEKPSEAARGLKLLPEKDYKELNENIGKWNTAPFKEITIP